MNLKNEEVKEKVLADLKLGTKSKFLNLNIEKSITILEKDGICLESKESLVSRNYDLIQNKIFKAMSVDILYDSYYRVYFYVDALAFLSRTDIKRADLNILSKFLTVDRGIKEYHIFVFISRAVNKDQYCAAGIFDQKELCETFGVQEFPKNIRINFKDELFQE